jgi:hypothetical protein
MRVLCIVSTLSYLTVFEPAQSDALALLFLNAHGYGIFVWQLFFGFHLAVLGYYFHFSPGLRSKG